MVIREGRAKYKKFQSWCYFKCWVGLRPEWREDIYVDTATPFKYCPRCHKEVVGDFYTPIDLPPPNPKRRDDTE